MSPFHSSRITGWVLLFSFAVFAAMPVLALTKEKKQGEEKATIFVIRGGGGYFPNLGTVINQKFEDQGLEVVDFRYHERTSAAKKIAAAYRAKQLPHGIIMIGYSLGGCGVIHVARILQKEGIPVRLLFLIETINPLQTVPANVEECFNLYHFPAILGSSVRADSKETKLVNCEAYSDAGLGLEYSHFAMPFVEEVHELIAKRLIQAINTNPPVKAGPGKTQFEKGKPESTPAVIKKPKKPKRRPFAKAGIWR